MLWLILCACLSFGFGQLFKWSQRRGCHAPTVISANYLTLAAVLVVWHLLSGTAWFTTATLVVGGSMGLAFLLSMLVMTRALGRAPVAIVLTAFRLAILVPVVVSVWVWNEPLTALQAAGIVLAGGALVLMTAGRAPAPVPGAAGADAVVMPRPGLAALGGAPVGAALLLTALAVFVAQGAAQVCLRWVHYAGLDDMRLGVLMVCAATAGGLGAAVAGARIGLPQRLDVGMGIGIGLYNLACLAAILTALSRLDATLFFPVTACLVVLLDGLCAHFGWKERLGRLGAVGAGLAAAAMLLVL